MIELVFIALLLLCNCLNLVSVLGYSSPSLYARNVALADEEPTAMGLLPTEKLFDWLPDSESTDYSTLRTPTVTPSQ